MMRVVPDAHLSATRFLHRGYIPKYSEEGLRFSKYSYGEQINYN